MPTEIIGKLQVRRQHVKRADGSTHTDVKVFIYIPTQLWRDSQFPFKIETQNVNLTVDLAKGMLIVEKASNIPGRGE